MVKILGVLGARNSLSKQIMQDEILNPILEDLGEKISSILLPAEPTSSAYIECWAGRQKIPVELLKSDWMGQGKRAGVLRDLRIQKDATDYLIFEGPKSRYYLEMAERLAKRHPEKKVYVVAANSVSPILLEVEEASRYSITENQEKDIFTLEDAWKLNKSNKSKPCLIQED